MIKRVARAIAFSVGSQMSGPGRSVASDKYGWAPDGAHLERYTNEHWQQYVHAATFAIQAMRDPTGEMIEAGLAVIGNSGVTDIHHAMIDSALGVFER